MTYPKPLRPWQRLPQNNKALRLRRRFLGQWHAQPQQSPLHIHAEVSRYELATLEWEKP